jgi:inosine-uridine nucleoside N-ribohydrolase
MVKSTWTMMTQKIILDTDIGSDIDDAVCLAYLLANPGCDLLGITTVTGEGEFRARMASSLCKIANKDIPIYIGAEEPLLIGQRQPEAPQAMALTGWDHNVDFPKGDAVEFIRQTIRKCPGEVTLLTIGPLTNIALLFKTDPEIPSILKELVMMCGAFTTDRLEWNAILDPHASAIVYNARVPVHRSIGTDVTLQVTMSAEEVRERFQAPLLRPVLDFAEVWFDHNSVLTFHDPLAAATLFDDQICEFTYGQVEVELEDNDSLGRTRWTPDEAGTHRVATTVDPKRFFKHYFSLFS